MTVPVPRLVAWEITRRCNLACRHCRASALATPYADELTKDESFALIDDIVTFARPVLILTGGEPLLSPHLADIAEYASIRGCRPVVGTNGTLLDAQMARRLLNAGVVRISISIDRPTAADHDAFRGVCGAFEGALCGFAAAREAGLEVQVNTTVTKANVAEIEELHDLAVGLGACEFHPFLLVPTGRGAALSDDAPTPAEYERLLRRLFSLAQVSPIRVKPTDAPQYHRIAAQCGAPLHGRGCLAGTGFCFVSHVGDVQPCGYFNLPVGNVRATPLSRLWRESSVFDDLRHPDRLKGKCGSCRYRGSCGGCRARALALSGDYLAEEPLCSYKAETVS